MRFVVEFYHSTLVNDPVFVIESATALSSMAVGDHLCLGGWNRGLERDYGKITMIRHNIYDIAQGHITHQVAVVFDYVESEDARA